MAQEPLGSMISTPLQGGAITRTERALLPAGSFSWAQNIRSEHPGIKKRKGQRRLHTIGDSHNASYNKVLTLYQFEKSEVSETRLFAQMSDGDILEATNDPPTVTTGAFGSESHSGSTGQKAASWGVLGDVLVHSNGVDQHQLFSGTESYVDKFIVFKGSATPPDVPTEGEDYSDEVSGSSGSAVLDDLPAWASHGCFFIKTPVRATSFKFTISKQNGNSATLTCDYRKSDGTWAEVSGGTDTTTSGGATLQVTGGTFSFTAPTDEKPHYQYGECGWWYRFRTDAALDSEVEISAVTFTGLWQDLENVWNGIPQDLIEVWVEGTDVWYNNSSGAIDLDSLTSGNKILLFCTDPIEAVYWDVGSTPNTNTGLTMTIKYTDGSGSFTTVGTVTDESDGLTKSGWSTFPRQTTARPIQHEGTMYYAYVYEVTFDGALSADTQVGALIWPVFDIDEYGKSRINCIWANRVVYSFDKWQQYLYVSAQNAPFVLNGEDYGILEAGDGRSNRCVAATRFYNEMIVWQEEKGKEGGCTTLFQGYSPTTFGKLLLSSRIGGLNAKSHAVVDGVLTATATDEEIKTLAFWLSRYGVCATDGRTVHIISDEIGNYFDPSKDECIRRGYEDEHWLEYDSSANVLRIGLVSGSSATVPNVFPVFDITDKTWSFDTPAQELSCMTEVSAGSGDVAVLQIGGGVDDGFVYQLNYGSNDVNTPIDTYVDIVLNGSGLYITLTEYTIRCVAKDVGGIDVTILDNNLENTRLKDLTLSMAPERPGQTYRRHRKTCEITGHELVMRLRNAADAEEMHLLDLGLMVKAWLGR